MSTHQPPQPTVPFAGDQEAPYNLPLMQTSFIGREREMVEVKRLLSI
jgi:hypothetical protein